MADAIATLTQAEVDLRDALLILTACRQDLDAIRTIIPPSKQGPRLIRVLDSLAQRIATGEKMWEDLNSATR